MHLKWNYLLLILNDGLSPYKILVPGFYLSCHGQETEEEKWK
jgi:hypothetical protein